MDIPLDRLWVWYHECMKSLLEKAKAYPTKRSRGKGPTPQSIELALAWIAGDIGIVQVQKAFGLKGTSDAYVPIATALKQAYQEGIIRTHL